MQYDDDDLWMDQPVQQWQANAGEGSDDDAGGDSEGDAVSEGDDPPDSGSSEEDAHDALQAAIDAGIDEADGKPPAGADEGDGEEGDDGDDAGEGDAQGKGEEGKGEEGDAQDQDQGPDPVNDPIPDEIKGRTRERMESLVSKVKEATTELEQVRGNYDEMMGIIQETGATPEQYGMLLQYVGAFNQGVEVDEQGNARVVDQAAAEAALQALEGEREILYRALGKDVPGLDPLEGHQDLKDAIEVGDLTEEHAKEIAEARRLKQGTPPRQQPRRQAPADTSQQDAQVAEARSQLNAIGATLKTTDPHYEHKIKQIMPKVKELLPNTDPSKWVELFRTEYAKAKAPARATGQQPLRGKQPAGGQQKAAGSLEEAVAMGIDQASGR